MSSNSKIEWTEATWNPIVGCTPVGPGCDHCYAIPTSYRNLTQLKVTAKSAKALQTVAAHEKAVKLGTDGKPRWTGKVGLMPEKLSEPLNWRKPRLIFVNSKSDLFHKDVPFEFIDKVFAVMALTPHHTYQVLTKRPERMAAYFDDGGPDWNSHSLDQWFEKNNLYVEDHHHLQCCPDITDEYSTSAKVWPLPNVWLGTSVEDQATADERIPLGYRVKLKHKKGGDPAEWPEDLRVREMPEVNHVEG